MSYSDINGDTSLQKLADREGTMGVGLTLANRRRSLASASVGNLLEWYEFSTYAVLSPFIALVLFSPTDPASALLATLGVFAVGFLARPLGGVFFGFVGDRIGRKAVLLITMLIMAGSCLAIGLLPTYAAIGGWASGLLLLFRCIQGFAHGGESATSTTYLAEIAPMGRRGLWGSASGVAIIGGSILAFVISALLATVFGDDAMESWGWRVPFLLGGLLAVVVLWMRRSMTESDVFDEAKAKDETVVTNPAERRKLIIAVIRMIAFTSGVTCVNYVWMSYMSTYAISSQGMGTSAAYWAASIGQLASLIALPFMGALSDRIGRKPMVFAFAVLGLVTTIPFALFVDDRPWTLAITVAASLIIWAMAQGMVPALNAENYSTKVRSRGIGFSYSLSVAVFGGTAPYLNQLFVNLGVPWVFYVYVMALCVVTLITGFLFKETKSVHLNDV